MSPLTGLSPSIIMTISSTLLALVLMPLCLWIYSRAWINTPVVNLMPFGAIILTLFSTLVPIGLGVALRYRYTRIADIVLKVNLAHFLRIGYSRVGYFILYFV